MDLYIDIGSTNIKWSHGKTAGKIPFPRRPLTRRIRATRSARTEIFSIVLNLIDTHRPQRAFFSVQMHGYVLLKEGREATGYISWRDERGKDLPPDFALTEEYGVRIKPNLPRLSLQAQSVAADEFCTLGSYLVYRLTGKNTTHVTDAAASGFYNVKTGARDACRYLPARSGISGTGGRAGIKTPPYFLP